MEEVIIQSLIRTVSKTGEFFLVSEETKAMIEQLPDDEKVSLYCRIRDESLRHEEEWRDEFIELSDIDEVLLPEPEGLPDEDVW